MSDGKMKIYEFGESCWANVPKIAIAETDTPAEQVEWVSIVLAEGKNFDPEYLKINPNGTVPTLIVDGKTFTDSTTVVSEILKRAPHPPRVSAHTSTSIVEEVHGANHDPNALLLSSVSDEDRQAKINGIPKGFLEGRQKALDEYTPNAPQSSSGSSRRSKRETGSSLSFTLETRMKRPDRHTTRPPRKCGIRPGLSSGA